MNEERIEAMEQTYNEKIEQLHKQVNVLSNKTNGCCEWTLPIVLGVDDFQLLGQNGGDEFDRHVDEIKLEMATQFASSNEMRDADGAA